MSKFINSKTWTGGIGTGDEIASIGPSLGISRRKSVEPARVKRKSGVVTYFSDRGYGFISSGDNRVFFHLSECEPFDTAEVPVGLRVSYVLTEGRGGKPAAKDVQAN
ncbi:cold-shock protein [Paenibacillus polymyxa]|uniref:cold-shock protein n=1 Tax=Paenibacillus polymyxa TaxID=1406 RepID=UPI002379225B|nr:cold shock domain-containing protein [Paenibacillus polymyxa]WDM20351.1 cold shock domain-containing protein [Paenibacillus polymyxa]